jgi:DNA-directed RNA polymerase subunit RPC12/RpoP
MVKCEKCGKKASDDLILCPHCGHRLKKPEMPGPPKVKKEPKKPQAEKPKKRKKSIENTDKNQKPTTEQPTNKQSNDETKQEKQPPSAGKPSSPHVKKPQKPTTIITILILLIVALTVVALIMTLMQSCQPDWYCGNWTPCENGSQRRGCVDLNKCETEEGKPETTSTCTMPQPPNNTDNTTTTTNNTKNCSQMGESCQDMPCCSGYCVHGICLETPTYCGDTYCDSGENCANCEHDCGKCQVERELEQNVFTEPLSYFNTTKFKENGYVIIRYFYNDMCSPCFYPDNFENELRDIAANYKDLVVVLLINTFEYPDEAEEYAEFSGTIQTPSIIVEGITNGKHDRTSLYSSHLSQKVEKYGVSGAVGREVCSHTDYCKWNETIEKTY